MLRCFLIFFLTLPMLSNAQIQQAIQISNLYPKGIYEVNLFNNYFSRTYKQDAAGDYNSRDHFYTLITQLTYGLNNRLNVGLDMRLRSAVRREGEKGTLFEALNFKNAGNFANGNVSGYTRSGISAIGPRIKYQPLSNFASFSVQHTILFPTASDLSGSDDSGFLDWSAGTFTTQFFFDQLLSDNFLFFAEVDFVVENTGVWLTQPQNSNDGYYQLGFPITLIGTYFANSKNFIYGLLNSSTIWANQYSNSLEEYEYSLNPYSQIGVGYKYVPRPYLQFEILLTRFFDNVPNAQTYTFNFGVRIFGKHRRKDKPSDL